VSDSVGAVSGSLGRASLTSTDDFEVRLEVDIWVPVVYLIEVIAAHASLNE